MKTTIGQTYLVRIKKTFRKHKESWYNGLGGCMFFAEFMGKGEYKKDNPHFMVRNLDSQFRNSLIIDVGRKTGYILRSEHVDVLCKV
jgi:hypothetical protein